MKAVLVIDLPKDCKGCPLHRFVLDDVLNEWFVNCQLDTFVDEDEKRPSQCPLRPLPHKLQADWYTDGYKEGFNACIDEITGETE